MVGTETNTISEALEPQGHVEVFRYMGLGPELSVSVFVFVGDLLESRPTENSIVADERADVAARYGEADCGVDQVCKEGNPILSTVSVYLKLKMRL